MTRRTLLVLTALGLQACASRPSNPETRTASPPPARPAPARPPSPLAAERQWLQSWFRGTPVQVSQSGSGALAVDVPREHSFEPGRHQVKPALGAVLDKLAESLRRLPRARVVQVAAPADADGGTALAQQRAHQVRLHLLARGIAPTRLNAGSVSAGSGVQLRVDVDDST